MQPTRSDTGTRIDLKELQPPLPFIVLFCIRPDSFISPYSDLTSDAKYFGAITPEVDKVAALLFVSIAVLASYLSDCKVIFGTFP